MKSLLFSLVALLGAGPALGQSLCVNADMPVLEVFSPQIDLSVDRTISRVALTQVAETVRKGEADGLTDVEFGYTITTEPSSRDKPCPVSVVRIELQAVRAQMYLARELAPSVCRYKAVLDHELKHVFLAQRSLDAAAVKLKKILRAKLPLVEAEYPAEARAALERLVKVEADAAVNDATEQYNAANEALDTAEEGHRLQRMCDEPELIVGGERALVPAPPSSALPAMIPPPPFHGKGDTAAKKLPPLPR